MIRIILLFHLSLLFACNASPETEQANTTPENKWETIFNGENLEGWIVKVKGHPLNENFANTFRINDGMLSIRYDGYGDDFDERFGAIYFGKELSNYRLKLDYRFVGETAPGAPEWGYRDSGVQFHSQSPASLKPDQPFPVCLEYNLHGGNGTDERPVGAICANGMLVEVNGKLNESYCTPPTIKKTFHGDQWVTLELEVKDGVIKHFANGEEILSYQNPVYNSEHERGKTFIIGDKKSVSSGYLSFQSNSHPIDFRNIQLLEF